MRAFLLWPIEVLLAPSDTCSKDVVRIDVERDGNKSRWRKRIGSRDAANAIADVPDADIDGEVRVFALRKADGIVQRGWDVQVRAGIEQRYVRIVEVLDIG